MQTPTAAPLVTFEIDMVTQPQLLSSDRLAPGCELTSAEAGVYRVECEQDPGTTGIPTIDGELVAQGCQLESPETGVFILDCEMEPFEPVPMSPAPLTIQVGSIGDNPPLDRAPQAGVCDGAAESYLEPGMEVVSNLLISLESVVYNNQDEDLVLYALHAFESNNIGSAARQQFMTPVNNELNPIGAPIQYGDVLTVGMESTCVTFSEGTMRLWRLDSSFGPEFGYWVIETIAFNNPIDLTTAWPEDLPNPQNANLQIAQPQFPVLVDGVVFRYLMPYVEPPITTLPGANQVETDLPQGYACEYAAPSFLAPGMAVMLNGYGYEQMPDLASNPEWETWTFLDGQFPLSDHGMSVYIDILNTTPLLNIPGNFEAIALSPQELLDNGTTFTTGTIVNGPFCTEATFTPPAAQCACTTFPCEPCTTGTGDPAPNRFYTWWEVDVTTNGQTHRGFYIENVGQYSHWLWATDGIFPRKLFLYYMQPVAVMTQPQSPNQDTVAPPVSQPTQVPPPTIEPVQIQPTQVPPTQVPPTTRPTQAPSTPMPIITPIQIQPTSTPLQVQPLLPTATPTRSR